MGRLLKDPSILPRQILLYRDLVRFIFAPDGAVTFIFVIAGLDPAIHPSSQALDRRPCSTVGRRHYEFT